MDSSKIINTVTIDHKAFSLFILFYLIGGVAVTMVITWLLQMVAIIFIGVFIIFLAPAFFQKFFRKGFITPTILRFYDEYFEVELIDKKTNLTKKLVEYKFSDIGSYKAIDSAKDDSSFLKIMLKSGGADRYTFLGQDDNEADSVTLVVAQFIRSYNISQDENNKISFTPPLFASKYGKLYIIGLTIILITAFCIELFSNPTAIPITLGSGFFLYLVILLQWKKDIDQYKKMK